MKINNNISIYQSVCLILLALFILLIVVFLKVKRELNEIKESANTEVKYYTYSYEPKEPESICSIDDIKIPFPVYAPNRIDTIYVGKDSTDIITLKDDSINIPITQKVYADSNYTAYVSGFNQQLDSIRFKIPIVTKTRVIENNRKFNIGAVGGVGYGFTSKKIEPFIGIGISFKMF